MKNWFTPRTLLVIAGVIILGLLVWRFSNIVAYILIASVLSLIARPLVRLLDRIRIGKWHIPVSIRALLTLMVIWALPILAGVLLGRFPLLCLAALIPLAIAAKAITTAKRHYNDPAALTPANGMTIACHLAVGILLTAALAIAG